MAQKGEREAARVTIRNAARMSKSGKRDVANWLRRQAAFLEKHNDELSPRFTARFIYH